MTTIAERPTHRFAIVEPEEQEVFGPYTEHELRMAMLDDLIGGGDLDDDPRAEWAEYMAMTTDSLIDEYIQTTDCNVVVVNEPARGLAKRLLEAQYR